MEMDVEKDNFVELQFPTWRPGRYERGEFVKNIHGFVVTNEAGKKVDATKITKDCWKVDCSNAKSIKVSYKYYAADLNAGSTFMDESQLYVNGVNCLIYKKEEKSYSCELNLILPQDFNIAAGKEFKKNSATFDSYHELVDTPFIASAALTHLEFTCYKTNFHLWFQGDVKLDEERIIKDLTAYTKSQIEKFEKFPVTDYHYIYQ
ncbi:MAG: putative metalloprotease with PDZ domain, partial [Arenicella sp.]